MSSQDDRTTHRGIATIGSVCALLMVAGALGPWVDTPFGTLQGWNGLGLPLLLVSFAAFGCQIAHLFSPRRRWLGLTALFAFLGFVGAFVLVLLVTTASHLGGGIERLIGRQLGHPNLHAGTIGVGWGLWIVLAMSVILGLVSLAGLFAPDPHPTPKIEQAKRSGPAPAAAPAQPKPGPATSAQARPVDWPDLADSRYVYVEKLALNMSPEEATFGRLDTMARALARDRGRGFGGVVYDDRGVALTPAWIDAGDCVIARAHGRLAVGAVPSHCAFDLSSALDVGRALGLNENPAIGKTGRWPGSAPPGLASASDQLFLGDLGAGWLEMAAMRRHVLSLDQSPDGATTATLELWSRNGKASLLGVSLSDFGHRARRMVSVLAGADDSRVRFSPDGVWLLVSARSTSTIVEVETGRIVPLPLPGEAVWSPAHGRSSLLVLEQPAGAKPSLGIYDLGSAAYEPLGPLAVEEDAVLSRPEVSPDGGDALCASTTGGSPGRCRLALITLDEGTVRPLSDRFLDGDQTLERVHTGFRWLDRPPADSVTIASSLLKGIREPDFGPHDEKTDLSAVGKDAGELVIFSMERLANGKGEYDDPHRVLPEVLSALESMKRCHPDWFDQTYAHYRDRLFRGAVSEREPLTASARDGWTKLINGWSRVAYASSAPIDSPAHRTIR